MQSNRGGELLHVFELRFGASAGVAYHGLQVRGKASTQRGRNQYSTDKAVYLSKETGTLACDGPLKSTPVHVAGSFASGSIQSLYCRPSLFPIRRLLSS